MEQPLVVKQIRPTGSGVFELVLERGEIAFQPGDCLALQGVITADSRPYSIASGTADDHLRFVIRHMPGGEVSEHLAGLRPGDVVRASPPFGWFRPGQGIDGARFVFVATGTGIAPFLSHMRSHPGRPPAAVLWGVRRLADAVDLAWIERRLPVELAVSRENHPGRHHGRVTDLLDRLPRGPDCHYFLCGLDAMIEQVSEWLVGRGVARTQLHRECFFNAEPLQAPDRNSAA